MAQMCGATAMKYYLPSNFIALGLGKQMSLMASGIEGSLKVGCTVIEMLIIDKVGRRGTLLLGSSIMAIALLVRSKLHYSGVTSSLFPSILHSQFIVPCIVFYDLSISIRYGICSVMGGQYSELTWTTN